MHVHAFVCTCAAGWCLLTNSSEKSVFIHGSSRSGSSRLRLQKTASAGEQRAALIKDGCETRVRRPLGRLPGLSAAQVSAAGRSNGSREPEISRRITSSRGEKTALTAAHLVQNKQVRCLSRCVCFVLIRLKGRS